MLNKTVISYYRGQVFSLKAGSLSVYNRSYRINYCNNSAETAIIDKVKRLANFGKSVEEIAALLSGNSAGSKSLKKFHNFELSVNAQRKMREKINWLFALAKSRYKKTYSGKEIYNFKVNFITLTLPSVQIHPTSQVTNECFNQWLTELRNELNFENYVWRLEFQKNGNVHYHLVTDCYIDYHLSLKKWNIIKIHT